MSTASGHSNASRPRIHLQVHQKEGSVPAIRTVQADEDSDVAMDELDGRSEVETEDEEEVDQLVSSEDEIAVQQQSASAPAKPKPPKGQRKTREKEKAVERSLAGQAPIPMTRIEHILDSDISEFISKEAVFVLSVATDAFIKRLASAGHRNASSMRRSTITYHDIASAIQDRNEFTFLEETIPQPLGLAEALKLRERKEKELLEPLLATPQPTLPLPLSVTQSISITLPPAHSISIADSTPVSAAPSPKPSIQSIYQASASTSKVTTGKGRRRTKQVNGDASANVSVSANASVNGAALNHGKTTINGKTTVTMASPEAKDNASAPPPAQPRRMSMREHKPRRRPDGQEEPPKASPTLPPPSATKDTPSAATSEKVVVHAAGNTRGRASRGRGAGGRAKAAATAANTPPNGRNGIVHTNGNGSTRTTRSRRSESAAIASASSTPRLDEARWPVTSDQRDNLAADPASGPTDEPSSANPFGRNGLTDNPGRTIYSQQRPPTTSASR